jgi:hypothetical protein
MKLLSPLSLVFPLFKVAASSTIESHDNKNLRGKSIGSNDTASSGNSDQPFRRLWEFQQEFQQELNGKGTEANFGRSTSMNADGTVFAADQH